VDVIWFVAIAVLLGGLVLRFAVRSVIVPPANVTLQYRGGRFVQELQPGRYWLLDFDRSLRLHAVPTMRLPMVAPELSVMSKDQFAFRIALAGFGQVTDARRYQEAMPDLDGAFGGLYTGSLYLQDYQPRLMSAALAKIADLTLDEFLASPSAILPAVLDAVRDSCPGVEVQELLLTSVTMPPEIRKMFTEIERAKREGLASLERARAEQASLRALANAARSLKSNPELAHLRLLQTLETAKGAKTIVVGRTSLIESEAG
jgi:regulator of protease activity HflC (stomatin/prohibitin superfamily)